MRRLAFQIIAILLAVCSVSCSIKEDRSGAPCYLTFHLDDADPDDVYLTSVIIVRQSGINVLRDTISIEEHIPSGYGIEVPKRWSHSAALAGNVYVRVKEDSIYVDEGRNFDRLWIHRNWLDCNWDTEHDYVSFCKEHTVVNIKPRVPVAGYYPYDMRLRSTTCGVSLVDKIPLVGRFMAFASRNRDGTLTAVLPRQDSDDLVLDIVRPDGKIEVSFQLGKMIAATGFDWTAENLNDITLTIDYASMDLSVKIESWDDQNQGVIII